MTKLVYFDTCVFLAYLNKDHGKDIVDGVKEILEESIAGRVHILTTALIYTEIIFLKGLPLENLDILLEPPIRTEAANIPIARLARKVRLETKVNDKAVIGFADSIHLATAIHRRC